jgi:hypothetical protein
MGKIDSKALASGLEARIHLTLSKLAAYYSAQRPAKASPFWSSVPSRLALQPVG